MVFLSLWLYQDLSCLSEPLVIYCVWTVWNFLKMFRQPYQGCAVISASYILLSLFSQGGGTALWVCDRMEVEEVYFVSSKFQFMRKENCFN